ncbi:MAG: hypothetical protein RLZ64_1480, partial [Pseudomonadota bacterium]
MQFSENWLRTLVDPKLNSDELSHLLTMSGLEVEEVEPVVPPFTHVVVAQVTQVRSEKPHITTIRVWPRMNPPTVLGGPAAAASPSPSSSSVPAVFRAAKLPRVAGGGAAAGRSKASRGALRWRSSGEWVG